MFHPISMKTKSFRQPIIEIITSQICLKVSCPSPTVKEFVPKCNVSRTLEDIIWKYHASNTFHVFWSVIDKVNNIEY